MTTEKEKIDELFRSIHQKYAKKKLVALVLAIIFGALLIWGF